MRSILVMVCALIPACATRQPSAPVVTPTAPVTTPVVSTEPAPVASGRVPPPGPYLAGFDALHYRIRITLPAQGDRIEALTAIDIAVAEPRRDTLRLDLSGLRVTSAKAGRRGGALIDVAVRQSDGRLFLPVPSEVRARDTLQVEIAYDGVPDDGLILKQNVHGRRSVFADNWPDRARFWFPSIDHPSDKAKVDFEIRAPSNWRVIANGRLIEEVTEADRKLWRYTESVPIPTYTMVIGAAEFTVTGVDACARGGRTAMRPDGCVAVTSWTFPQDSADGARIFRRTADMLWYYSDRFTPFPYEKLAHVQSATKFGGMENVSAIFYSESAVADGSLSETTVAHETVHQWFGDAVTPHDWAHLWLSEGFATYFGIQYFENADGVARFRELLANSANGYLTSDVTNLAIVDTARVPNNDLMALLNANSYNKGGQVLHMLRGLLGDAAFFDGLRRYYREHEHGTARTDDLRRALEAVSGQRLDWFFEQWVYKPGHPIFRLSWTWDAAAGEAVITLEQQQPAVWPTFRVPIEIAFDTRAGEVRRKIEVSERRATARIKLPSAPTAVRLDPDEWILKQTRN